jgi:hypothetical protein
MPYFLVGLRATAEAFFFTVVAVWLLHVTCATLALWLELQFANHAAVMGMFGLVQNFWW